MAKKGRTPDRLTVIRKMPPLRHSIPGRPFRMEDSEVVRWLVRQPDVMNYLFDKARAFMCYDSETGTWRGTDYEA